MKFLSAVFLLSISLSAFFQVVTRNVKTTAYAYTCYQGKADAAIQALQQARSEAEAKCASQNGQLQIYDEKLDINLDARVVVACSGVKVDYTATCLIFPN